MAKRRPSAARLSMWGICLLLALAALALPIEGSQSLHLHHDGTAAIYNAECPLSVLAAFKSAAPLPSLAASVVGHAVQQSAPRASAPSGSRSLPRHTDPRAPPLA